LKNPFKPRTTIGAIEAEMTTLAKRRHEVAERITSVHAALEAARLERRETLSSDGDHAGFTGKIRELTHELADLEALIIDIDTLGEDAAARLARASDEAERAASAAALDKIALAAELRVPEIEKAVATLAKVIGGLKADLGNDVGFWPTHNAVRPEGSIDKRKPQATGREVVAAILADSLARALPWIFDTADTRDGYRSGLFRCMAPCASQPTWEATEPTAPLGTSEIIDALVSSPLREKAAALKSGTTDVEDLAPQADVDDYIRPSAPANVTVFVTRSFSYLGSEFGGLEIVPEGWQRQVPEPVADIAEARNLCVRATSARGEALLDAARKRKGTIDRTVRSDDCVELGDCMHFRVSEEERAEVRRAVS
jgi:hypothetical protein